MPLNWRDKDMERGLREAYFSASVFCITGQKNLLYLKEQVLCLLEDQMCA